MQIPQGDGLSGALAHPHHIPVPQEFYQLHQHDIQPAGAVQPQGVQGPFQAGHMAVVIRAPDVDYQIEYDNWFYESTLHESGAVAKTVNLLAERGWTYEKEGALFGVVIGLGQFPDIVPLVAVLREGHSVLPPDQL